MREDLGVVSVPVDMMRDKALVTKWFLIENASSTLEFHTYNQKLKMGKLFGKFSALFHDTSMGKASVSGLKIYKLPSGRRVQVL